MLLLHEFEQGRKITPECQNFTSTAAPALVKHYLNLAKVYALPVGSVCAYSSVKCSQPCGIGMMMPACQIGKDRSGH